MRCREAYFVVASQVFGTHGIFFSNSVHANGSIYSPYLDLSLTRFYPICNHSFPLLSDIMVLNIVHLFLA